MLILLAKKLFSQDVLILCPGIEMDSVARSPSPAAATNRPHGRGRSRRDGTGVGGSASPGTSSASAQKYSTGTWGKYAKVSV